MTSTAPQLVRQAVWQAKLVASDVTDKVSVRNLQVSVKAGSDAWGRRKEQPALISVTLSFKIPFATDEDILNTTTVDYGKLSKDIRLGILTNETHLSTNDLALLISNQAQVTAGQTAIAAGEVDVFYPKASLLGDGAGLLYSSLNQEWACKVVYLKNVRVPCIIGLNEHERTMKQPVVINLWVDSPPDVISDDFHLLERLLVKFVEASSCGTIEKLARLVVEEISSHFFTEMDLESWIRIRIEKPLAVPFADAPSIEILRPARVKPCISGIRNSE
ncbi:Dihydroneopterin aldolase-domain-containing protein [Dendryphion nanum]|uniref:dihydroneopterin aldolase n=1 Tax=Dendryphion nanum TaxID=256645 RepID=A0A9P9DL67_9PLEO|nr:Dihydroneopterin aldolase-domain-containing protein [Dendryphion nanum]